MFGSLSGGGIGFALNADRWVSEPNALSLSFLLCLSFVWGRSGREIYLLISVLHDHGKMMGGCSKRCNLDCINICWNDLCNIFCIC